MSSAAEVLRRFDAPAINCFTGSFVQLADRHGWSVDESAILERGDGFLLRCGLDEWGFPEYGFPVEEIGLRGLDRLGAAVESEPLDAADPVRHLSAVVRARRGAVVWTNSHHLSYAEIYVRNPGYLHALLVTDVSDDLARVRVFDSLIVDRERHGCEAWLPADSFRAAITDRVATETYDHMGFLHSLTGNAAGALRREVAADLRRQAELFLSRPEYRGAVTQYQKLCADAFAVGGDHSARAARRLFDHIKVLYVVPSLVLLRRSIERIDGSDDIGRRCGTLTDHWRTLAVLALKFEATGSAAVRGRIDQRFGDIDAGTTELWRAILAATTGRSGDTA
ncbi:MULTISPECIES: hypothetical protein [unclassified Micromonospora]|uniref:hypothetical protein n=1 Tax=unclassified Micromonospora TaxID=2617518 RepID=UPI003327CE66